MRIRLLLILWFIIGGSSHSAAPAQIIVLGDSLSSAHGLAVDLGWVNLLQQRLQQNGYPHQVLNASISGDTTSNGLTRLESLLDHHQPEIVIVELGGNDGLRAQSVSMIRENLEAIVKAVRNTGSEVVLAGMRLPPNYGPDYVGQFEQIYPDLAQQYGATLVPFFMEGIATSPELMQPDGIHPDVAAQPLLLDNIWQHLEPILQQ